MNQQRKDPPSRQSSDIEVREAREADLRTVAALSRQWEAEGITRGLIRDTPRRLRKYLGPFFLVAESQAGEIVGYVCAGRQAADRNCTAVFDVGTPYLDVENVYVVPGCRGRDLGGRMLDAVMEQARAEGIEHAIVFSASMEWERVVAFYARHGFKMWFFQMFK